MSPRHAARILFVSLALGAGAGACGQAHLSPNYASSYKGWFVAQRAAPSGDREASQHALNQLDAQEAAGISANYRHNVNKDATPGQSQLLMVNQPHAAGAEAYMPPPSVPVAQ
jgi:hypothetical protein